ncbi:MAG: nitroreductase [Deltaproteobacteria bacterium]|nr:MAG: nitroreductase [Deltaproteobacteria bacterium]
MTLKELVSASRSCRRFEEDRRIPLAVLEDLVSLVRLCPSAGNLQPLRYVLSTDPGLNEHLFHLLGWAAYLKDWKGPEKGSRPAAYVAICCEGKRGRFVDWDTGIAAQTLLLGARENGIAGCMIGSFNPKQVGRLFDLSETETCCLVLALGYPKEFPVIEPVGADGGIKYYRDAEGQHHVPKWSMDTLIRARYGA